MKSCVRGNTILSFLLCVWGSCYAVGYYNQPPDKTTTPLVTTDSGCIKGTLVTSSNRPVSVFLGIPYAEPPTGENRFKKPKPAKGWDGTYDATVNPPPCMQFSTRKFPWVPDGVPSEDCLYLNVWVPEVCQNFQKPLSKYPVLIWIHGGGYQYGSIGMELYDGASLAANGNVIVVSMNYRLGAFGFLQAGTEDAPGNMGLYDQNLAMKWVKDNIEVFGGDTDSITLVGHSAGSVSVGLHLISPLSRNLFNRAIMQSGSPYHTSMALPLQFSLLKGSVFAASVGCANETVNLITAPDYVMACLRSIDAGILAKADSVALEKNPFSFIPNYGNDFLPKSPIEIIESGDYKHTDLLIGNTKDEGALFLHYIVPELFTKEFAAPINIVQGRMLIMSLFQNSTHPTPDAVADFYLHNVNPSDPREIVKAVYDSFGDFVFTCPSIIFAEKNKNNVFYYLYTHKASNSIWGEWMGTTHMEEVPFVFGDPLCNTASYTRQEVAFSRNIIRKWATFARYGKPTQGKSQEYWPTFTKENPQYLELNPRSRNIGTGFRKEACDFWRGYYAFP